MAKEAVAVKAMKKQIDEQEMKIAKAKAAFDLECLVKDKLCAALRIIQETSPKKKKNKKSEPASQ